LSKAGPKGEEKRSKGTDQQVGHRQLLIFHLHEMKDKERKKRDLPLTLTFPQQFEINACDLLQ
jgi:hypothetical protein